MIEASGSFSPRPSTEELLRSLAAQNSLKRVFGALDDIYEEHRQEGAAVEAIAALALMDSSVVVEIAKKRARGASDASAPEYLVHEVDLSAPQAGWSRRRVARAAATRNGDVVLTLAAHSEGDKDDMCVLPGTPLELPGEGPIYGDHSVEYFSQLRQRLGIEL